MFTWSDMTGMLILLILSACYFVGTALVHGLQRRWIGSVINLLSTAVPLYCMFGLTRVCLGCCYDSAYVFIGIAAIKIVLAFSLGAGLQVVQLIGNQWLTLVAMTAATGIFMVGTGSALLELFNRF